MTTKRQFRKAGRSGEHARLGPKTPQAPQAGGRIAPPFSRRRGLLVAGVFAVAGLLAYSNSFSGPFIFDDTTSIPDNPHIRKLWPIWEAMDAPSQQTADGRPILCLSLALNYRISGLDVWSYHAVNLAVHVLAGLTLFGVVRRTLLLDRLKERFGASSTVLALICALVWLVHPLATSSVTYMIQRAESLMGLFYLLTLYCAIRSMASRRPWRWYVGGIVACGMGMGTKEVMFTAPIMVLLCERIFAARPFKEIFRRRWGLYAGLAATWAVLGGLLATVPRAESVGFGFDITPFKYAATQCNVIILYYLAPALWPGRLVFDYGWPLAESFTDYAVTGAALIVLLAATAAALRRWPALGFLGAWFFLILGPTSSFLPIATEIAAEHRMYLPLAAVIVGAVLAARAAGNRLMGRRPGATVVGYVLAACVVAGLGLLTFRRNNDYRSDLSIWQDTKNKVSWNSRAHHNLASAYGVLHEYDRAISNYNNAIEVAPGRAAVSYKGRGDTYWHKGDHGRALEDLNKAIELDPQFAEAYKLRGSMYAQIGKDETAIRDLNTSISLKDDDPAAYNNRAVAFEHAGRYDEAIRDCDKAVSLDPYYCDAYNNRAVVHWRKGNYDQALRDANKAIELNPKHTAAYMTRADIFQSRGQVDQSLRDLDKAVELEGTSAKAYWNRGMTQRAKGDHDAAIRDFNKAIEVDPKCVEAYRQRGSLYSDTGDADRALADYDKAIELDPNHPRTYNSRGMTYGRKGELDKAIGDFDKAVELDPKYAIAYSNRGMAYGNKGDYDQAIRDFDMAIRWDASFASAYHNRATALRIKGNYDQAIRDFQKVAELATASGEQALAAEAQAGLKQCQEVQAKRGKTAR